MRFKIIKKYKSGFLFFVILAAAVSAWMCQKKPVFSKDIRNVLLISIDTCRADYVSCYGYSENTTPAIDKIAEDGILFENVVSPCPFTRPSHSSMLTGTIPPYHNVHDNETSRLSDSFVTVAEMLKDHGFTTGAVISSFVLDARFGTGQGFDYYNDQFGKKTADLQPSIMDQRPGGEAGRIAREWLEENTDDPFFLFLHFFDPHFPYHPPEPFKSDFADDLYAGEIAYVDHCIGKLIQHLKDLDLYDSTLLIIAGDHGEDLNDHGEDEHGFFIYDTTIKVPLIIRAPGAARGKRVQTNAGLIDIMPTILEALQIPIPKHVQGTDLNALMYSGDETDRDRPLFCETLKPTEYGCNPLLGLVSNNFKYIQTTRPELYDLKADPDETRNIIKEQPHRARIMQDQLKHILKTGVRPADSDSSAILDAEDRSRLESLGYISAGSADDSLEFDQTKKDAKDSIKLYNAYLHMRHLMNMGKYDQAMLTAEKMLERFPDFPVIHRYMGEIAHADKKTEKAITYYTHYLERDPASYETFYNLGRVYANINQFDDAETNFARSLQLAPDYYKPVVYNDMGAVQKLQGKSDAAINSYQNALLLNPDQVEAHAELGSIYNEQGKFDQAVDHYKKLLRHEPESGTANRGLARIYYYTGKPALAKKHYEVLLRADTKDSEARLGLANTLFTLGEAQQALEQYRLILETAPDHVIALHKAAWILATGKNPGTYDADDAVALAARACELTGFQSPEQVDTLAAAYAAKGNFSEAIKTAEKAIQLAGSKGETKLTAEIKNRLALYQKGLPYLSFSSQ